MTRLRSTIVLCASLLLCACRAGAGGGHGDGVPEGTWTLVELGDADLGALARPAELTLGADGTLAGYAGVNRFTGQADAEALRAGRLQAGPLAATRRAGLPAAMAIESRLLALLGAPLEWRRSGEQLELLRDGAVVARWSAGG